MTLASKIYHLRLWVGAVAAALCVFPVQADTLNVFAAASLRGALDEIAQNYGAPVVISYAGSGLIARQVSQGAPADVVVLAHANWMEWLTERGHVIPGSVASVAKNTLVVIAPQDGSSAPMSQDEIVATLQDTTFAMGHRDAVPAGTYAKAWFKHIGVWDQVASQAIETDNVRLALALVARGEVPFGVTYLSDALSEPRVKVVHVIDQAQHPAITYPAGAVTNAGVGFVQMLATPAAQAVFRAHGFTSMAES